MVSSDKKAMSLYPGSESGAYSLSYVFSSQLLESDAAGPRPSPTPHRHCASYRSVPLSAPTLPAPTLPAPTLPAPSLPSPTLPASTLPAPTLLAPTLPGPTLTAPTLPGPTLPAPTLPAPTLPAPTLPAPTLPAPTLPAPTLPAPTLPAPTLPAPTLPAPTLPAPTLPAPKVTSETDVIMTPKSCILNPKIKNVLYRKILDHPDSLTPSYSMKTPAPPPHPISTHHCIQRVPGRTVCPKPRDPFSGIRLAPLINNGNTISLQNRGMLQVRIAP
ncbi:uncharacterized protein LOC131996032 [Stomoxys calcitrans]|uniref:uncharacterized protein LOC131996032 n=1 Tax=Stomoxys calcitrans TaxID=35570 RepID=UPI0027E2C49F|nr:uncharacterized protein LOC131996032 [Stomoxys calcitrans]